jgi:hypothetical protein
MERDSEVESVLAEIRQQLRAAANGDGPQSPDRRRQALAQLEADLAVTGRAWNRLPPVVSDRRGAAARLEVWIKRQLRRATNWLTWEQINFNAATNDALRLAHGLLAEHETERAELRARVEALSADLEELRSLRAEVESLRASAHASDRAR